MTDYETRPCPKSWTRVDRVTFTKTCRDGTVLTLQWHPEAEGWTVTDGNEESGAPYAYRKMALSLASQWAYECGGWAS